MQKKESLSYFLFCLMIYNLGFVFVVFFNKIGLKDMFKYTLSPIVIANQTYNSTKLGWYLVNK